jgi:2-polyprenyl-6-methoxyphenol hydroxylase-like FAD-dependent oxidoreductase
MKSTRPKERGHAIVIGASMAGLLAARVLANHFRQVTVVDRDAIPLGAGQRRGVPQGRHTHGLLASGRNVLEKFFPGISAALLADGAVHADVVRDLRWFMEGSCLSRPVSGLNVLLLTRPMLEAAVRERVSGLPNVQVRDDAAISDVAVSAQRITGVHIGAEALEADLVVDATGRGSRTPQWLEKMGFERPREDEVKVSLGYTTRFFRRLPDDLGGDLGVIIPPTPEGKRGGVMVAQEGGRWTVTLITHFGAPAPEDLDGFVEFARTLPAPYIHEVLRRAEALGDPAVVRFPASIRRRYEGLSRFPSGLLVIGDAMCSFNPIYAQGMSVAALQAAELERTLEENPTDLARRFFARAAKVIDTPWSIAAGADLRMKETVGPRNVAVSFINWYVSKVHQAAHTDPACSLAFHKVSNLLAPPSSLMRPRLAFHALGI